MTPPVTNLRNALRLYTSNEDPRFLSRYLSQWEVQEILKDWRNWGRLKQQIPPEGTDWRSWLILGGRGAGKTRAGAEWVKAIALGIWEPIMGKADRIAIVAPTFAEARLVMIEGKSGLLAIHDEDERPVFEPSKRQLTWPNGCVAHVYSAEEPDGLRGPQFDAAWCDELAKWKHAEQVWDMLSLVVGLSISLGAAAAKLFPFLLTPGN